MENRRHKRRPFGSDVALTHDGVNVIVKSREIGPGGMLIEMHTTYTIGDVVQICFILSSAVIEARAEVRYGRSIAGTDLIGIKFLDLSDDHQALIDGYTNS